MAGMAGIANAMGAAGSGMAPPTQAGGMPGGSMGGGDMGTLMGIGMLMHGLGGAIGQAKGKKTQGPMNALMQMMLIDRMFNKGGGSLFGGANGGGGKPTSMGDSQGIPGAMHQTGSVSNQY